MTYNMLKLKILFLLLCAFFLGQFTCEATDLKPWFGKEYEVEIRTTLLYQYYYSLVVPHRPRLSESSNDLFLTLSAAYPFKRYCCEFEATVAHTHHQNYRWDNFRFTGRCQFLDEFEGDCISAVVGLTLMEPFSRALHDVSSFHHGHLEAEATLSVGKQYGYIDRNAHQYRWWNVAGLGNSDIGSPWVREYAAFEYQYKCFQYFRLFVDTLWGTGWENLMKFCFIGYGNIRHQSVDVGFRYSYDLECWGTLSLQYARRVYALNFPEKTNRVLFEYYLPFGIQFPCSY